MKYLPGKPSFKTTIMTTVITASMLGGASSVNAQRVFRSTEPLEITFTTNLKVLIKDRDSTKFVPHGAVMSFPEANGKRSSIPITLKTRGHFRRQARNCDFPPLLIDFKKKDIENTLMQGNAKLKITTNCKPKNNEYEQYILQEYALYRLYQRISPVHFRTRLARVTYKDSAAATPDVTTWAFLVEDEGEVAKQYDVANEKRKGAVFDDLEPTQLGITSLFQYMVGNTDWSTNGLHNISLLRDSTITIRTVAYDFDWSGVINARYAFPNAILGIKFVTERLYRGPCMTPAQWQPIFARFLAARPAVDSIYNSIPALEPKRIKNSLEYYNDFWKTLNDPKAAKREVMDRCEKIGN